MSNLPQEMRVVKVISTMTLQPKLFNLPNGATWGDVLSVMSSDDIPPNYRAVVRETKQDLVERDARLPDGDATIWMTPTAVKSGEGESLPSFTEIRPLVGAFEESLEDAMGQLIESVKDIILDESDPGMEYWHREDDEGDLEDDQYMQILVNDPNKIYESLGNLSMGLIKIAFFIMLRAIQLRKGDYVDDFMNDLESGIDIDFSNERVRKALLGTLHQIPNSPDSPPLGSQVSEDVMEMIHFFNSTLTSS